MVLITTFYNDEVSDKLKDATDALVNNLRNRYITNIIVLTDGLNNRFLQHNKITIIKTNIEFDNIIEWVSKSYKYGEYIISKPFVKYDISLSKIRNLNLTNKLIVIPSIGNPGSTDSFIFSLPIDFSKYEIFKDKGIEVSSKYPYYSSNYKNLNKLVVENVKPIQPIQPVVTSTIMQQNKLVREELVPNVRRVNKRFSQPPVLIKKEKSNQVTPNGYYKNHKIDIIVVSVNYNDFLAITLKQNKKFGRVTVATTSDDLMCHQICQKYGVNYIISDRVYEAGAKFNKGKIINDVIKSLDNPEWILHLDADIVLPDNFSDVINSISLEQNTLYGTKRAICRDYETYKLYKEGKLSYSQIGNIEQASGFGFFQMFNMNNDRLGRPIYPEMSGDASWSDLVFRDKFTKRATIELDVIHLGDAYQNWTGRRTERFISDEVMLEFLDVFDINRYFDGIFCLNLITDTNKWNNAKLQFDKYGINIIRFNAVDGNNLSNDEVLLSNPTGLVGEEASKVGVLENKFALACLMSHLEIIKFSKEKKLKRILIFEDDVVLSDGFISDITKISKLNWKLLYLGASQFNWDLNFSEGFYYSKETYGTFAYCLTYEIYDEIIELLETKRKSIDNLLIEYQKNNFGSCYTLYPNIVISDVGESTIRDSKNMIEYSKLVNWKLENFSYYSTIQRRKSISIIIPCYGHSDYLIECVSSCLSQTVLAKEIVILLMDEKSKGLYDKLLSLDSSIKCFISDRMNLSSARNFCVGMTTCDYFIPLDADDKLPPNFIEEVSYIDADVVYVGSKYFGSEIGTWPNPITEEVDWDKLTTFRRNSLVCTSLIKKSEFIGYNGDLWAYEDMDLWIRMYKSGRSFKKCFTTWLDYRKHNSQSLLSNANSSDENIKSLRKIIMNNGHYSKIPKIIHWVWIGNKDIPSNVIDTWKKNLPDGEWEYKLWNESNFDMNSSEFLRIAYEEKKYGICVDIIRAKVLYEYGGIWLDADCLITDDISPFLQYDFIASWEGTKYLNIGFIGCSPKLDVFGNIYDYYNNLKVDKEMITNQNRFVSEIGTGPIVLTNEISKIYDINNGGYSMTFDVNSKRYRIETPDVFVLDDTNSGFKNYAIHLYDGSWTDKKEEWSVVVRRSYEEFKNKNRK